MKLFSKRNISRPYSNLAERRIGSGIHARRVELVSPEARNRLVAEIKYLSSSNDFLEWFILFENQQKSFIIFDENKIDSFSLSELGYSMSSYFQFYPFKMVELESKSSYASDTERSEKYFDDYKLFDIAEITILFSKNEKRQDVIDRFNSIFEEENTNYQIVEHLITKKTGETLKNLVTLLKDNNLKAKLEAYYSLESIEDLVNASKLSADIVNIIFSGYIKDDKPKAITTLKTNLIKNLIIGTEDLESKKTRLGKYIDNLLLTSRDLSNDIYDIRHTEKSTISISNENIYKLISSHNMSVVELVLTTLKDDYVLGDNWESIKKEYIKKYKIDPNLRKTLVKPEPDPPTNLDDIPF